MDLTTRWNNLLDSTGLDDRVLFVIGGVGVHVIVFWGLNFLLFACYKFNLFPKYRIQGSVLPPNDLWNAALWNCIKNHFFVQPVALYCAYPFFVYCGVSLRGPIPDWTIFVRDFLISIAFNDTLFYWAHRGLHHKSIYKYIHKQHHEFKVNIGIASEYAHPVEDVLANLTPTLFGCMYMGSHALVLWAWLAFRLMETIDAHSGYSFSFSPFSLMPFQGGARRHDFHHSRNVGCYGSFTIFWDWICGTDAAFLEFENKRLAEEKKSKGAAKKAQ